MSRLIAIFALLISATLLFWQLQYALPEERPTPSQMIAPPVAEPRLLPESPAVDPPSVEPPSAETPSAERPSTEPPVLIPDATADELQAISELRARRLSIPVTGVEPDDLWDTFDDPRSGNRTHRALDIPAPRGTPVVAVEAGTVAQKFENALGGLALYQLDASQSYCYYYAHLDGYAPDVLEGEAVERGQVLGYVGSTGNAPDDTPHLHFAIYDRETGDFWCQGPPINPFPVFTGP